jgi:hypothetical protein
MPDPTSANTTAVLQVFLHFTFAHDALPWSCVLVGTACTDLRTDVRTDRASVTKRALQNRALCRLPGYPLLKLTALLHWLLNQCHEMQLE